MTDLAELKKKLDEKVDKIIIPLHAGELVPCKTPRSYAGDQVGDLFVLDANADWTSADCAHERYVCKL